MRRDASEELTDIASQLSELCHSLVHSRRQDTLSMSLKLGAAQKSKEKAEAAKSQAETALKEKETTISKQDKLIAYYESVLGKKKPSS